MELYQSMLAAVTTELTLWMPNSGSKRVVVGTVLGLGSVLGFALIKWLIWKPIRLYVLAQYLPGVRLEKLGRWAVVTGATDGIGKHYARELASRGLDIVLISRSADRLNTVKDEIVRDFQREVKVIQADFKTTVIYERIGKELEGLEIAVLVNNVGMPPVFSNFLDIPELAQVSENLINVNCMSGIRMTGIVLPGMVERRKGVVVNMSSCLQYLDSDNVSMYAATKSFISKFSGCIRKDYSSSGVIIQTVTPGMISTKMLPLFLTSQSTSSERLQHQMFSVRPDVYVSYAINTIGWAEECDGHPKHHFIGLLLSALI